MSDVGETSGSAAQEPSMEDILSSIRRILSEDGENADQAAAPADPVAPAAVDRAPARDLHPAAAGSARGIEPDPPRRRPALAQRGSAAEDIALAEVKDDGPSSRNSNVFHLTPDMLLPPERQVLSETASAASTDVLSQLAKAILDRRDIGVGGRDMTIEGLVREMLRPLLREWLDRNLPYLIERLVKKEIDLMVNRAERLED